MFHCAGERAFPRSKSHAHTFFFLFCTGSNKNVILDGQHKFSAAKVIRDKYLEQGLEPPSWCRRFRAKKLFLVTPKATREMISGREQARTKTVKQQAISDMCRAMNKEIQAYRDDCARKGTPALPNKASIVREVYMKCGCSPNVDGTVVCFPTS